MKSTFKNFINNHAETMQTPKFQQKKTYKEILNNIERLTGRKNSLKKLTHSSVNEEEIREENNGKQ